MFSKTAEALGKAHQAQRLRLSSRTDPVRHAFNEGLADTLVVIAPSLDNIDHFATVNKAICLLRMLQVDWGKARAVVEAVGLTDRNQRYDFQNLFFAQAGLIFERHTVIYQQLEKSLDNKARRYAKRVGLYAKNWRGSLGTSLNNGGFMLLEPNSNRVVAGEYFNLTAVDVMATCEGQRWVVEGEGPLGSSQHIDRANHQAWHKKALT